MMTVNVYWKRKERAGAYSKAAVICSLMLLCVCVCHLFSSQMVLQQCMHLLHTLTSSHILYKFINSLIVIDVHRV